MSLISVIVPAFNQARFLRQAIQSALEQTHPWVEVVVVDDGSTDETGRVLDEYRTAGNVTVIRQANAGLPAARNRGLAEARGEFVCFLDSDDFLAPAHLERLLAPLALDPTLGFAYCDVQMVDVDGRPANDFSVGASRRVVTGDIFGSLLAGGYFPPHTVLVRREALDEAGGFEADLGGHADYELWMRLAAGGRRAHYVDEKLAFYRVYDGSMSGDREHMQRTRVAAIERVSRRFPARTAGALSELQELSADLHAANAWLHAQWQGAVGRLDRRAACASWSLLDRLDEATLLSGAADRFAVWHVDAGDGDAPCVYLHPPAELQAVIPIASAGTLTVTVGLHPDVWTNPESSGCVFTVVVDDTIAGTVALDPLRRAADRRWVTIGLDVPESPAGRHVVTLSTAIQGTGYFAWGLFKNVRFTEAD